MPCTSMPSLQYLRSDSSLYPLMTYLCLHLSVHPLFFGILFFSRGFIYRKRGFSCFLTLTLNLFTHLLQHHHISLLFLFTHIRIVLLLGIRFFTIPFFLNCLVILLFLLLYCLFWLLLFQ